MKTNLNVIIIGGVILISTGVMCDAFIQYALAISFAEALGKGNFNIDFSLVFSRISLGLGILLVLVGLVFSYKSEKSFDQAD